MNKNSLPSDNTHNEFISKTSFNSMDLHQSQTQYCSPSYSVTNNPRSIQTKSIKALKCKSKSKSKSKQLNDSNNNNKTIEESDIDSIS